MLHCHNMHLSGFLPCSQNCCPEKNFIQVGNQCDFHCYQCIFCDKAFDFKLNMFEHVQTFHTMLNVGYVETSFNVQVLFQCEALDQL